MRLLFRLALGLALLAPAPALAEERITNFVSDVHVQRDGALDVVETISLVSEGDAIKRGILRDFPTRYRGGLGSTFQLTFDVLDVTRDGQPEPYQRTEVSNGTSVRIGSADTILDPGPHVYRIHYRTTRQIGFFRDFDELYWNATGTGWTFPIERAEARITLPAAAPFGKRAVYTGAQGSTAHNAAVVSERPGQIVFRTTAPLDRREGLTVAVAWRKGIIAEPGFFTRLGWMLRQNGPMMLALAMLLAVVVYAVWLAVRAWQNPDKRPIVPLFSPPDGFSAAGLRYVSRMGFDSRTFATAIVDAAVRGALRIVETSTGRNPDRALEKTDKDAPALPAPEAGMVRELFRRKDKVALKQANHNVIGDAVQSLNEGLDEAYGKDRYFSDAGRERLRPWSLLFVPLLLVAWLLALLSPRAILPAVFGIGAVALLLYYLLRRLSRYRAGLKDGKPGWDILSGCGWIVLGLIFLQACAGILMMGVTSGNPLPMLPPLLAFPVLLFAWSRLRAPTPQSWPIRAQIEGFRMYLDTAEEDRLEKLNPPEKTAALFERYLPYAMALGVENRWAKRFTGILAAASIDDAVTAQDRPWYSSPSGIASDPGALTDALGRSFTTTIASAASAPGQSSGGSSGGSSSSSSSSSGSSGGGSSGGGGGGGGGSGW